MPEDTQPQTVQPPTQSSAANTPPSSMSMNTQVSQAGIPQQQTDNTATGAPAEKKGFLANLFKLFGSK